MQQDKAIYAVPTHCSGCMSAGKREPPVPEDMALQPDHRMAHQRPVRQVEPKLDQWDMPETCRLNWP